MPGQIPRRFARYVSVLIISWTLFSAQAFGENWPGWRGPRGDGSTATHIPLDWNGPSGKNIAWKTAIPGEGHSSPVVWGDNVLITTCIPDSGDRQLLCLERKTGRVRWQQSVLRSRLESKHALNSFASSTPSTDGELIYVSFLEVGDKQVLAPNVSSERLIYPGQMLVAAFDFAGNLRWIQRVGPFVSAHGFCSNPVLYQDLVILNGDHDGDSYLIALNRETGELVWKQSRRHQTRSYCTPLIREVDGTDQLVLCGSLCLAAFNPKNGKPIWNVEGPTEQFVASMVFDGSHFFAVGGYPTHHVISVDPTGRGDVSETHVRWHETNVRCYVPSPIVVKNFLIVADDRGTANCFDTKTGKRYWQSRMGRHYSGSLIGTESLAFLTDDDGVTKIIEVGEELKIIAENQLGERSYASPAVSDGQLFLRGKQHLFCIESPYTN